MHRHAREQVLEALAWQQIAVAQGCLAEFGQQRVAAAVHMDADAVVVLCEVTDFLVLLGIRFQWQVIHRFGRQNRILHLDRLLRTAIKQFFALKRFAQQHFGRVVHSYPLFAQPVDRKTCA